MAAVDEPQPAAAEPLDLSAADADVAAPGSSPASRPGTSDSRGSVRSQGSVRSRHSSVISSSFDLAAARAAADKSALEKGKKALYLRKKRRQARLDRICRWGAAAVAVLTATAFFTLLLSMVLCEKFNMAQSCSYELQPEERLPVLAIIFGFTTLVFWSVDVCYAGMVRRKGKYRPRSPPQLDLPEKSLT